MKEKLIITPKTKVAALLDAYPYLENVLIELSPAFAKLRNPVLRKTVARVTSLQQASAVGGIQVQELINRLRKETGQEELADQQENSAYLFSNKPDWFNTSNVKQKLDAIPIINAGDSPMAAILGLANKLEPGQILEVKTPFVPAPIIDMLKEKGFTTFSILNDKEVLSYFIKDNTRQ